MYTLWLKSIILKVPKAKIVHQYATIAKREMAAKIQHGHRKVDRMCLCI